MANDSISKLNGFYAVFMSGTSGEGYTLLVFADGDVVGVDPFGVTFDGSVSVTDDGYVGTINVSAPPGGELIQGATTGSHGLKYTVTYDLPTDFLERDYVEISTPLGPVNAKFKKVRDLGALMK